MSSNVSDQEIEENFPDNQQRALVPVCNPKNNDFDESELCAQFEVPSLVGGDDLITEDTYIKDVLGFFIEFTYTATQKDPRVYIALDRSIELIERDYNVIKISNYEGNLTSYYPSTIPFIDSEKTNRNTIYEASISSEELTGLLHKAHRARCRQRFPVSVIMYKGKIVCRSSTLASAAEVYTRLTVNAICSGGIVTSEPSTSERRLALTSPGFNEKGWRAFQEIQLADISLLKQFKVETIVDLMVENRKSKLGVPVTSSEKVDKDNEYHSNFKLLALPYPGCEFFREFHNRNFNAEGLYFNWSQSMCDAELSVPEYPSLNHLNIDWENYKQWDLVQMTQNYIKYIIKYLQDNNSGILIHCISGWDRTPLFISLIRLSLWADGVIHQSLNAREILYLTLAYDWMLFGHHLTDRLSKKEDILLFCFNVLKYLIPDEFSVLPPKPNTGKTGSDASTNDSGAKSFDKKTESSFFPHSSFEEGEASGGPKEDDMLPSLSPDPVYYPEESNDSMDFSTDGQSSILFPASPENRTSPDSVTSAEIVSPVPMEVCEGGVDIPSLKRTSPVEIPSSQGSCSSKQDNCSIGSWMMVTGTGSIRGSDSQSEIDALSAQGSHGATNTEEGASRKIRLTTVRQVFYRCYYHTINEKHVNYTTSTSNILYNILSNLAEIANVLKQKDEKDQKDQSDHSEQKNENNLNEQKNKNDPAGTKGSD